MRPALTFPARAEVDVITAPRTAQTRLAAIYLLMPTSQNVELVLRDHGSATPAASSSRLSKKKDSGPPPAPAEGPKYASAYLNFIDGEFEPSLLPRKRAFSSRGSPGCQVLAMGSSSG